MLACLEKQEAVVAMLKTVCDWPNLAGVSPKQRRAKKLERIISESLPNFRLPPMNCHFAKVLLLGALDEALGVGDEMVSADELAKIPKSVARLLAKEDLLLERGHTAPAPLPPPPNEEPSELEFFLPHDEFGSLMRTKTNSTAELSEAPCTSRFMSVCASAADLCVPSLALSSSTMPKRKTISRAKTRLLRPRRTGLVSDMPAIIDEEHPNLVSPSRPDISGAADVPRKRKSPRVTMSSAEADSQSVQVARLKSTDHKRGRSNTQKHTADNGSGCGCVDVGVSKSVGRGHSRERLIHSPMHGMTPPVATERRVFWLPVADGFGRWMLDKLHSDIRLCFEEAQSPGRPRKRLSSPGQPLLHSDSDSEPEPNCS